MANFVFNIAKGRVAKYADLPLANDALILVLLNSSGIESDAVLIDKADLAALVSGTTDECTFSGYTRRTLAGVTVTVDNTNDRVDVSATSPSSYTNTGSAVAVAKAVICYDDDTTTGTDSALIPLVALDCVVTFDT